VSYHLHNETSRASELVEALKAGGRIAVVSDAGMPGIADPGEAIAAEAIAAGVDVFPIPGANAALSALIASGLSAERFAFHGFLPSKEGARRTFLEEMRSRMVADGEAVTRIVYETPHRVVGALEDVVAVFGAAHRVVLARELTKLHEEFLRGSAGELLKVLQGRDSVRGEMVLLLSGEVAVSEAQTTAAEDIAALVRSGVAEKDALKQVAKERGVGKSELYREWQRVKR